MTDLEDGAEPEQTIDLAALREEYSRAGLTESDLEPDPLAMFDRWLREALAADLYDANAMVVATVGADFAPSSRMVLLKGVSSRGFVFYTNTGSRKGRELAGNPRCALLFPWHPLERQVRVDGLATPLGRDAVEEYFASRPRKSRLGAWASHQSHPVRGRDELQQAFEDAERRFPEEVPAPEEWGGYVVRPEVIEFWQGRPGRMHDRLVYRREGDVWRTERLAP